MRAHTHKHRNVQKINLESGWESDIVHYIIFFSRDKPLARRERGGIKKQNGEREGAQGHLHHLFHTRIAETTSETETNKHTKQNETNQNKRTKGEEGENIKHNNKNNMCLFYVCVLVCVYVNEEKDIEREKKRP